MHALMGMLERLLEGAATVFRYTVDNVEFLLTYCMFIISIDCEFLDDATVYNN